MGTLLQGRTSETSAKPLLSPLPPFLQWIPSRSLSSIGFSTTKFSTSRFPPSSRIIHETYFPASHRWLTASQNEHSKTHPLAHTFLIQLQASWPNFSENFLVLIMNVEISLLDQRSIIPFRPWTEHQLPNGSLLTTPSQIALEHFSKQLVSK